VNPATLATTSLNTTFTFIMSKSRMPLYLCAGGAGAVGYYLYSAGGDPKAAGDKMKST
jgi:hypothetical protein